MHKALHVLQYWQQEKQQGVLLSLDVQKSFDSLEIPFLKAILYKMGFGHNFMNAIQALYTSPKAKLKINNCYSGYFSLGRGTRRGAQCHRCCSQLQ